MIEKGPEMTNMVQLAYKKNIKMWSGFNFFKYKN